MKPTLVLAENIYKKFYADSRGGLGALEKLLNPVKKEEIHALQGVSFSLKEGEIAGVIGKNASGKSTLLRVVAGIYAPDSGKITTQGKIAYLPGMGFGLAPKLTMLENIYLMGSLRGVSKREMKNKVSGILDFSEMEKFLHVKTYQFSTGMLARLNFSVAMACLEHQSPDVILLDEVFGAGGDMAFRAKASQKMGEIITRGPAVMLVMHSTDVIKKYCHKVFWIDSGKILEEGPPEIICKNYIKNSELNHAKQ